MERVVRVINRVPNSRSRREMFWLAAAGEIPIWRAAEAIEPPSRVLTKVSMARRFGMDMNILPNLFVSLAYDSDKPGPSTAYALGCVQLNAMPRAAGALA